MNDHPQRPASPRPGPHDEARAAAASATSIADVGAAIVDCFACPRLVAWREQAATDKVARFRDQTYWGRPVPGFGDPAAGILIVGLAPAAHGGNRTGRVFTGDRSGDVLFGALHAVGLANQPSSEHRDDGLRLDGAYVAAAVRCAPPANRPTPVERDRCLPYLVRELELLSELRVVVALGAFGWDAALRAFAQGGRRPRPRPRFGHGAETLVPGATRGGTGDAPSAGAAARDIVLLGTYHPSQQNTFTGRLTPAMLESVLRRARALALS